MASNGFTHKWIQSSRGLPGSFMNENHHTMAHVWKGDEKRQDGTATGNQTSATSTYMDREQKHDHQIQQSNEMGDLLGQEPHRSILGPHNDHFQSQQANFPDDSEFYSQPKKNQDFPVFGGKTNDHREELGDDPDPATKAAYQSATTKPIMTSNKSSEAPSVATSFDSNRAIKNQPFVSDAVDEDDYDDDADYYTTSELTPAAYAEDGDDQKLETPTSTPLDQVAAGSSNGMESNMMPNNTKRLDNAATKTEKTAPLRASDMYHQQQEDQNISAGPKNTQQQGLSSSSLRGDNTIQNSLGGIGDKYKNQDLATKQSNKPLAQQGDNGSGNAAKINNAQVNLQQPTETQTYSNDQIPNQLSNFNTLSLPNDVNQPSKADGRRRSSLTQSIGKLFRRHHKSS